MKNKLYKGKYLLSGIKNGQKIRPSNWYERLMELDMNFDIQTKRFHFNGHLYAIDHPKYKHSVVVDFDALETERPDIRDEVIEIISLLGVEAYPISEDEEHIELMAL